MTGMQRLHHDDERLAHRLRAIDPARGVAPLPEHRIEEIMSSTVTPGTSGDTQTTDRADRTARRRRVGIVAGLATAAAAAAVVTVVVAQPNPGDTLALSYPDTDVSSLCAPVAPEYLVDSDIAFEGRVTGIEGSTVTLEVLHQYTGEAVSTVTIPQGSDELSEITIGPLESGGTYLISAIDGRVVACGMSGRSTPELKSVYEEAFP